jgi:hypothetical protein
MRQFELETAFIGFAWRLQLKVGPTLRERIPLSLAALHQKQFPQTSGRLPLEIQKMAYKTCLLW